MQLDVYRRREPAHKLSYLIVPAGHEIPQEATSTEWTAHARSVELDEHADELVEYGIEHPEQQLEQKGYAITSLDHQLEERD
ncbi:DUF6139 family protein [Ramlibacter rhizophilus]|uniref:YcgL domain-containing protein n=1 Tax=Ramlibacter rhizophilus TaxID=1781167 RepID=A0A4Z0C3S9_9BURK|nr:DUF6139 family protein [Ramlibacter rhizophilus]TFZ04865.1 hypothetical protein EZ242_03720 [Ramlibacter rhizophilus]